MARRIPLTFDALADIYDAGGRLYIFDYNRNAYRKAVGAWTAEAAWRQLSKLPSGLMLDQQTGDVYAGRKTPYRIDIA